MSDEFNQKRTFSAAVRYTIVALVLGLITAFEVAVLYPPLAHAQDTPKIVLLVVLSVLKFVLVVALFMHLWQDPFLYTALFGLGLVLACGTMVALVTLLGVYSPPKDAVHVDPSREVHHMPAEDEGAGAGHSYQSFGRSLAEFHARQELCA
ncbi:MAG: cytochrome C oxidase subunit IV family protein [Vulcanimicrobiota bacterium]